MEAGKWSLIKYPEPRGNRFWGKEGISTTNIVGFPRLIYNSTHELSGTLFVEMDLCSTWGSETKAEMAFCENRTETGGPLRREAAHWRFCFPPGGSYEEGTQVASSSLSATSAMEEEARSIVVPVSLHFYCCFQIENGPFWFLCDNTTSGNHILRVWLFSVYCLHCHRKGKQQKSVCFSVWVVRDENKGNNCSGWIQETSSAPSYSNKDVPSTFHSHFPPVNSSLVHPFNILLPSPSLTTHCPPPSSIHNCLASPRVTVFLTYSPMSSIRFSFNVISLQNLA